MRKAPSAVTEGAFHPGRSRALDRRVVYRGSPLRHLKVRGKLEPESAEATDLAALTRVDPLLEITTGTLVVAASTSALIFTPVGFELAHRFGP